MGDTGRLVLGTVALGLPYGLPAKVEDRLALIPAERATAVVQAAWEMGIRTFDTAPAYGCAETRLGTALQGHGIIWSKLAVDTDPMESLERSLVSLQRRQLDLLQWHNWSRGTFEDPVFARAWRAFSSDSRVLALGCSTYGAEDALAAVTSGHFACVQVEWNLLNQAVLTAIGDTAHRKGVRIAVRSVWLQGILQGRPLPAGLQSLAPMLARAGEHAQRRGLSLGELALRAALDHPAIDHVLIGVDHPEQLIPVAHAVQAGPMTASERESLSSLHVGGAPTDPRTWAR